jgi:hypothetical protein
MLSSIEAIIDDKMRRRVNSAIMISPDLNFREFLKKLEGMDKPETIRVASRESYEAKDIKTKRGDKAREQKLIEYISDLGSFLYFVHKGDNSGLSWPEAFLTIT